MAERAVVNTLPLIFLSRSGLIDLLQLLSPEIVVPEIVATEIEVRGQSDPTAQAIANTDWLLITQTPPVPAHIQAWGLGPGESSVLAWAYAHPGSEAILDDLAARAVCRDIQHSGAWHFGLSAGCETAGPHSIGASGVGAITPRWNVPVGLRNGRSLSTSG